MASRGLGGLGGLGGLWTDGRGLGTGEERPLPLSRVPGQPGAALREATGLRHNLSGTRALARLWNTLQAVSPGLGEGLSLEYSDCP